MRSTSKSEMNHHCRSNKMHSIIKTKNDNDVNDHKGVTSIEYDIELSRPIGQCVVYDQDEIGQ